ncbi:MULTISPECIES: hypothetical protein [unclassified Flavobacterium]|uniref:hypothetical protein n=1 Tax=unclassified Flavobacterium TaxID=196869 RepID=UPI000F0C179C|nr:MULTISPECIES: hypothetical protein [unclassified Flavobacterium]AYN05451.1 hypothetical protein EAG11_15820 [Flavobacterium sp. 140616W15]MCD0473394.1 hypothetical protein [Flavobacterium sp. EDS]
MDIQLEKLELIKMLTEIDNPEIIESIKKILTKEKKDWWNDLTDRQKEDITQSELEFEKGEFTSFEDVMKKYR